MDKYKAVLVNKAKAVENVIGIQSLTQLSLAAETLDAPFGVWNMATSDTLGYWRNGSDAACKKLHDAYIETGYKLVLYNIRPYRRGRIELWERDSDAVDVAVQVAVADTTSIKDALARIESVFEVVLSEVRAING